MLKERAITAAVLISVVLLIVFAFTPVAFALFTAALMCYAGWEYSKLIGLTRLRDRNLYILAILASAALLPGMIQLCLGVLWWFVACYFLMRYVRDAVMQPFWARIISGPLVLAPAWVGVNYVRLSDRGRVLLLFLFALIWIGDTAAYFVGSHYGKNKFVERISPKKTWEGFYAAIASSFLVGMGMALSFHLRWYQWPICLFFTFLTVLFSVLGDLYESMLKREQGVKDSGQILPGHGGLMDRLDSLTAAAPIYAIGAYLVGLLT